MCRFYNLLGIFLISIFLTISSAHALPVNDLFKTFQINQLTDDSYEYLINEVGNDEDIIDVGDRLRGMFRIDDIGHDTTEDPGSIGWEITGVFDLEVTDIGPTIDGFAEYIDFGPSGAFSNGQTIAQFYADDQSNAATDDYEPLGDQAGDPEERIATATDGTLLWEFGFTGASGEGWRAENAPLDITSVPPAGAGSPTSYILSMSLTGQGQGLPLARNVDSRFDDSLVHISGFGNIFEKSLETPLDVKDNLTAEIYPTPEPTTLLLFGTGLLGLAAFGRKKFMRKS